MEQETIIQRHHHKPAVKVVLLGNSGAGKSSLAQRFVFNKFNLYSESTIGASFFTKFMVVLDGESKAKTHEHDDSGVMNHSNMEKEPMSKLNNGETFKSVKFHVWDTAGQEKYHSLAPMYYRGAMAAVLVYDICNAPSFEALSDWLERLKEYGPKTTITRNNKNGNKNNNLIIIIVGNKCDLEDERQVSRETAESFASSQRCLYIESSARDNIRVEEIFQIIARLLPEDMLSCSTDQESLNPGGILTLEQDDNNRSLLRRACGC